MAYGYYISQAHCSSFERYSPLLLYRDTAVQRYRHFSTEGSAWFTQSHLSGYLPGKRI